MHGKWFWWMGRMVKTAAGMNETKSTKEKSKREGGREGECEMVSTTHLRNNKEKWEYKKSVESKWKFHSEEWMSIMTTRDHFKRLVRQYKNGMTQTMIEWDSEIWRDGRAIGRRKGRTSLYLPSTIEKHIEFYLFCEKRMRQGVNQNVIRILHADTHTHTYNKYIKLRANVAMLRTEPSTKKEKWRTK